MNPRAWQPSVPPAGAGAGVVVVVCSLSLESPLGPMGMLGYRARSHHPNRNREGKVFLVIEKEKGEEEEEKEGNEKETKDKKGQERE